MQGSWQFTKLTGANGTWADLVSDWTQQCTDVGEAFTDYAVSTMPVLASLVDNPVDDAGVFGLHDGNRYVAVCQLNAAYLPQTQGKTLRVRHVLVSPYYDFAEVSDDQLGTLMGQLLFGVHRVSGAELLADHIRIHLRSPLEMTYFRALGGYLGASGAVKSVESRGAWIYLTK